MEAPPRERHKVWAKRISLLSWFHVMVTLTAVGLAQERHVGVGRHELLVNAGKGFERAADEHAESGDKAEAEASYRRALVEYQRAVSAKPNHLEAYVRLGRVHGVLGEHRQAAAILKLGLRYHRGSAQLEEQLAIHLTLAGFKREGIPLLERVAARNQDAIPLQTLLADHYRDTRQAEKAVAVLRRILRRIPRAYNRWVELGGALLATKQAAAALVAFRRVPATVKQYGLSAQIGIGDAQRRLGRPKKALAAYRGVMRRLGRKDWRRKNLRLGGRCGALGPWKGQEGHGALSLIRA